MKGVSICKAIDDMIEEGERRGERRGREEGERRGREEGEKRGRIAGAIQNCKFMNQTKESTLSIIIAQFQMERKEAEELVEANWG